MIVNKESERKSINSARERKNECGSVVLVFLEKKTRGEKRDEEVEVLSRGQSKKGGLSLPLRLPISRSPLSLSIARSRSLCVY
jgi:hypothetical protein